MPVTGRRSHADCPAGRLYAGSSGFSYDSWKDAFYPSSARPADYLRLYADRLPSVELNVTFRRLPSEEQFRRWADQTPPDFRFAVKVSRTITHMGRLERLGTFCERARALGEKLGPLLVQFPPTRPRDDGYLRLVVDSLDDDLGVAFEFRDASWEAPEVDDLLATAGRTRVGSLAGTAPFRYLRLRDPPYDEDALRGWAERLAPLLAAGTDVYCYFKHEDEPLAPRYAERLLALMTTP